MLPFYAKTPPKSDDLSVSNSLSSLSGWTGSWTRSLLSEIHGSYLHAHFCRAVCTDIVHFPARVLVIEEAGAAIVQRTGSRTGSARLRARRAVPGFSRLHPVCLKLLILALNFRLSNVAGRLASALSWRARYELAPHAVAPSRHDRKAVWAPVASAR